MIRLLTIVVLLLAGCSAPDRTERRPVVLVSVPPYAWIVEALLPDVYEVVVLVPPAANPVTHEPSTAQLARLGDARLWVAVGHRAFPFDERWRTTLLESAGQLDVIESASGQSGDPHVWVDPRSMGETVDAVAAWLTTQHPTLEQSIATRREAVAGQIAALDAELVSLLGDAAGKRFIVFHPAWSHLTDRFALEQLAIEHDHKEPSAHRVAELIDLARQYGHDTLFVQPQFDQTSATALGEQIGARVVTLDPLAADWFAAMPRAAAEIARAAR